MQLFSLLLEWFPNPDHVPLYAGRVLGFYEQEGLDLSLLAPSDPDDSLKLAAAGKVDVALNYQPNLILARAKQQPVVAVGLLIQDTLDTVMYLADSGVKSLADLRGRRIGVAVDRFDESMFRAAARHAGLSGDEFQFVDVGFDFTGALLSGKVDASMGAFRNYERIEAELAGARVGILELADYGIPNFYQLVFVAHERAASQRDEPLGRFLRGTQRALEFTLQSPDEAFSAYLEMNPALDNELNRLAFKATLPHYARTQQQSHECWQRLQEFMLSAGVLAHTTPTERMFANLLADGP